MKYRLSLRGTQRPSGQAPEGRRIACPRDSGLRRRCAPRAARWRSDRGGDGDFHLRRSANSYLDSSSKGTSHRRAQLALCVHHRPRCDGSGDAAMKSPLLNTSCSSLHAVASLCGSPARRRYARSWPARYRPNPICSSTDRNHWTQPGCKGPPHAGINLTPATACRRNCTRPLAAGPLAARPPASDPPAGDRATATPTCI
jgi:hypothetical protein